MDSKRILGVALSAVAATGVLGVAPAQAAHRHVSRPAVVWADFQKPAAWDNPKDTLHYYVMSPVVTRQMVGRVATSAITSPASIDCKGFNAGYAGADAWVSVPFTVKSCSDTTATVTYRVTKAMVGQRVSVIGWTATSTTSATIVGRFRVGSSSNTVSVTAQRAAAEVPVGPQTSLGSWNGKDVSIASGGGVNEIWVGDTKYSAPEGTVAHVDLTGSVVNMWIQNSRSMDQWKLDLATGNVTTQSVAVQAVQETGTPGFVATDPVAPGSMTYTVTFYTWEGRVAYRWTLHQASYPFLTFVGFTADAVIVEESSRGGGLGFSLVSDQGVIYGSDMASMGSRGGVMTIISIDAAGFSYDKRDGVWGDTTPLNPLFHCRITAAGRTCTQA